MPNNQYRTASIIIGGDLFQKCYASTNHYLNQITVSDLSTSFRSSSISWFALLPWLILIILYFKVITGKVLITHVHFKLTEKRRLLQGNLRWSVYGSSLK